MLRRLEKTLGRGGFDDRSGIHHGHPVGHARHHAQVVTDPDHRHVTRRPQLGDQVQNLRLNGHVERRRGLVGNQQIGIAGQRHRDHRPLAHPAGKLVGVVVEPRFGPLDTHGPEQFDGAIAGLATPQPTVHRKHLGQLSPDGEHRVESGARVLKDHADLGPAHAPDALVVEGEEVAALEAHRVGVHLCPVGGQQTEHREHRGRLAAAAFAHQRQGLAAPHREADAVDRVDDSPVAEEAGVEAAHAEEVGGGAGGLRHRHRADAGGPAKRARSSRMLTHSPRPSDSMQPCTRSRLSR